MSMKVAGLPGPDGQQMPNGTSKRSKMPNIFTKSQQADTGQWLLVLITWMSNSKSIMLLWKQT